MDGHRVRREVRSVEIAEAVGAAYLRYEQEPEPLPAPRRQRTVRLLGYADPDPTWVTILPDPEDGMRVAVPARNLARELGLGFKLAVHRFRMGSLGQWSFEALNVLPQPVLLVHDELDRDDVPVVDDLLRAHGVPAVFTHPIEEPEEWWNQWLARQGSSFGAPGVRRRPVHPRIDASTDRFEWALRRAEDLGHHFGRVTTRRDGETSVRSATCTRCGATLSDHTTVRSGLSATTPMQSPCEAGRLRQVSGRV